MLEIKVKREDKGTDIEVKMDGNPVMFNAEFMAVLDTILKENGKKFIGPALFCFIEKNFTKEEITDGLNRAKGSRIATEFITKMFPTELGKKAENNQPKPQNLQKNCKNKQKDCKKEEVKHKKPKVKVTEFDNFEDFIADLEKTFRGE